MDNYSYSAKFEHGGAQGEVRADSEDDAKAKVTKMYDGVQYDSHDADGAPISKNTVVTEVTVTLIKE